MSEEQTEIQPLHITVDMEKNVYSQSGEDGIIEALLQVYGIDEDNGEDAVCIEIGANDGKFCSNTANLRDKGWKSLLIESDPQHQQSLSDLPGVTPIIAKVTPENASAILFSCGWLEGCDVLSCDTDGDDVEIVKAIISADLRPRILVIEYNPTFPPFLYRMNPRGTNKGSSIRCVIDELDKLEYDCVYATISNVILVDRRQNDGLIRSMNAFEAFRWDDLRFVCSDFDGQNYVATMSDIVETVVNPWDRLLSVKVFQYPDRLLGYKHNWLERADYQNKRG